MRIFVHRHLTFMQDTEHLCSEHQHRVVDCCRAHRFLALEMVHPRHSVICVSSGDACVTVFDVADSIASISLFIPASVSLR